MNFILTLCLVAAVAAAPPPIDVNADTNVNDNVQLLQFENAAFKDNKYSFRYEQTDGQAREEQGELTNAGLDNPSLSVKGSYHWVGPDGVKYLMTYNADKGGYQPTTQQGSEGAALPVLSSIIG